MTSAAAAAASSSASPIASTTSAVPSAMGASGVRWLFAIEVGLAVVKIFAAFKHG